MVPFLLAKRSFVTRYAPLAKWPEYSKFSGTYRHVAIVSMVYALYIRIFFIVGIVIYYSKIISFFYQKLNLIFKFPGLFVFDSILLKFLQSISRIVFDFQLEDDIPTILSCILHSFIYTISKAHAHVA